MCSALALMCDNVGVAPSEGGDGGATSEVGGGRGGWEVTTHETGCPRAWLRQSRMGRRTGYDVLEVVIVFDGFGDRRLDGNARDDR